MIQINCLEANSTKSKKKTPKTFVSILGEQNYQVKNSGGIQLKKDKIIPRHENGHKSEAFSLCIKLSNR